MKLTELVDECFDKAYKAIEYEKDVYPNSRSTETEVSTEDGIISMYVSSRHGKKVQIIHDKNEHCSPNLEKYIEDRIPDWWDVEDAREEYCDLDSGFSSWNDYYAYKY